MLGMLGKYCNQQQQNKKKQIKNKVNCCKKIIFQIPANDALHENACSICTFRHYKTHFQLYLTLVAPIVLCQIFFGTVGGLKMQAQNQ